MILEYELYGNGVKIFIKSERNKEYDKLLSALLNILCENESEIEKLYLNNKKIILFDDILKCFEYTNHFPSSYIDGETKCICGVRIENVHEITHKSTGNTYFIGSTCKDHWTSRDFNKHYCLFCGKNKKDGNNCKNCQQKKEIRNIFTTWKKLAKDKVSFGKYYRKMSYYKLAKNDPSYCRWVINESNMSENIKSKLRHYMD
jgi:hypothetical protein